MRKKGLFFSFDKAKLTVSIRPGPPAIPAVPGHSRKVKHFYPPPIKKY